MRVNPAVLAAWCMLMLGGCSGRSDSGLSATGNPGTNYLAENFDYADGIVPSGWMMIGAPEGVPSFRVEAGALRNEFSGSAWAVYTARELPVGIGYCTRFWVAEGRQVGVSLAWRLSEVRLPGGSGLAVEVSTGAASGNPTHVRVVQLAWAGDFLALARVVLADTTTQLGTGYQEMTVVDCPDSIFVQAEGHHVLSVAVPEGIPLQGRLALADLGLSDRASFNYIYVGTDGGPPRCSYDASRVSALLDRTAQQRAAPGGPR